MSWSGGPGGTRTKYGDHDLSGIYYGIVTQNDDPDGPGGRVKVRFPWMPEGDRDQSHWAHVCVPMIGAEFGTYVVPEVEDSVYVVFIAGDINHPVVIGGAWNEVDEPPEVNQDGKNDFRLIKSRSGHRLVFDDTAKTKIVLSDHLDENVVALGPHQKAGSSPKNTYEVPAPPGINGSPSEGVSMAAMTGDLNIWCPAGTLKVEATNIELTATQSADLKAGGSATYEGTAKANCISNAPANYQGGPSIKIGP